jgi:hypothetical protein
LLNKVYPDNNGIFFYMGTRAENKFSVYYDIKGVEGDIFRYNNEYFLEDAPDYENLNGNNYLSNVSFDKSVEGYDSNCDCPVADGEYFADIVAKEVSEPTECIIEDYFADEYGGVKTCAKNGLPIDDEYFEANVDFGDIEVSGFEMDVYGYEKISTDNKFIYFNHTNTGYTVNTWDESIEKIEFYTTHKSDKGNKFLNFNHTTNGETVETWDISKENMNEYDVFDDLKENAFALRINENGGIGYRYIVSNCNMPNNIEIIEEYSISNIIKENEWVTINVQVSILDSSLNKNKRRMVLRFYVNGKLIFVSKDLPEFRFRRLNDIPEKQEGVPFNISLGGGTMGLIEGVWVNEIMVPDSYFPLMKYFGGSFIGDLKSFRFYESFRDYPTINSTVFADN